jgi:hypothetical protein
MSFLRPLLRGIRALLRPSAVERDVDDEVQHYFHEAVAAHMARGLSADDTARAARREMGQVRAGAGPGLRMGGVCVLPRA